MQKQKRTVTEKLQKHLSKARAIALEKRIERIKNDECRRMAIDFIDAISTGKITLTALAFKLNEAGHRSSRGTLFNETKVKHLLAWRLKYYPKQVKETPK